MIELPLLIFIVPSISSHDISIVVDGLGKNGDQWRPTSSVA